MIVRSGMNLADCTWGPIGEVGRVTGDVCGLDCGDGQSDQQEGGD